jgi:hypothetical protein
MAGVIVFGVPVRRFAWARLYVDDVVDASGTADINSAVDEISGAGP